MTDDARDGAYDDFLDAIEAGEGCYLECANGHGWLPLRRVCPECGSRELAETPLPEAGEVRTYTTVAVATPQFSEDAPYVTATVVYVRTSPASGRGVSTSSRLPHSGQTRRGGSQPWPFPHSR